VATLLAWSASSARADELVQVPVDALLNARTVSTLTGGVVVPWTEGVDTDDGFMTLAAAKHLGEAGPALPDDARFPADAHHPDIVLHFSNAAAANAPQARVVTGAATFQVTLAPGAYARVFLSLTSSYGDSPLTVTFTYADASTTTSSFTLPDWGTGNPLPTTPPIFFDLVSGLHKWNRQDESVDTPTHGLTGVALSPSPDRILVGLTIEKASAKQELVFWGATALVTSAVDGGTDAGAAAPDGAADADSDVRNLADADADADAGATDAPPSSPSESPDAAPGNDGGSPTTSVDAGPARPAPATSGCELAGGASSTSGLPVLLLGGVLAFARRRRRDAA